MWALAELAIIGGPFAMAIGACYSLRNVRREADAL